MAIFNFNLNVSDSDIQDMEEICGYYNISFEEFLNILIYRSVRCGELPFYPTYDSPNMKELLDDLNNTDGYRDFNSFNEMIDYIERTE